MAVIIVCEKNLVERIQLRLFLLFLVFSLTGFARSFVLSFQFARDIETEAKEQNVFLDQFNSSLDNASGLLSNTLYNVMGIPKHRTKNRKFMCYLILIFVVLMLLAYWAIFRRS